MLPSPLTCYCGGVGGAAAASGLTAAAVRTVAVLLRRADVEDTGVISMRATGQVGGRRGGGRWLGVLVECWEWVLSLGRCGRVCPEGAQGA